MDHCSPLVPWDSGCKRVCTPMDVCLLVCMVLNVSGCTVCCALPLQDVSALGLVKLSGYTVEDTADSKKQLWVTARTETMYTTQIWGLFMLKLDQVYVCTYFNCWQKSRTFCPSYTTLASFISNKPSKVSTPVQCSIWAVPKCYFVVLGHNFSFQFWPSINKISWTNWISNARCT